MADYIVVNPAELEKCAREYHTAMDSVLDAAKFYSNAIQALSKDYTGKAAAIMALDVIKLTGQITEAAGRASDGISELMENKEKWHGVEDTNKGGVEKVDPGTRSPFA